MIGYLWFLLVAKYVNTVPERTGYGMAHFLGRLRYWQWGRGRRNVMRNLAVLMGRAASRWDLRRVARRVFLNFGLNIVEIFRFPSFDKKYFDTHCRIFSHEHIKEALARGKGAIFLSAHFGNWELGVAAHAALGHRITVIALPQPNERVNRLFIEQRAGKGIDMLPSRIAPRQAIKILRENGVIGMLGERITGNDGVPVDFCGRKVLFPKGPAWLAAKSGAAILPMLAIRRKDNTFTIFSAPPIYPPDEGAGDEWILTATQRFASFLEPYVRRYPDLWAMFYDFFARQSADSPRPKYEANV